VLLELIVSPPEVVTVVEEQLDWPPPEFEDAAPCAPLELPVPLSPASLLGPALASLIFTLIFTPKHSNL